MRALVLNCTLKASVADYDVRPGVSSDKGDGDQWPRLRSKIPDAEILVMASPTWLGQPSSVAKRVLERMDAMQSETDDQERPVAYNRVAGVVVTGADQGHDWSISTGRAAAGNLAAVARALQANPIPPLPGS